MEEFKWIFYVLLAVIVLVVRMWLKAFSSSNPSAANRPANPKNYPVPTPPATSYQDILKEMQASGDRAKKSTTPIFLESKGSAEKVRREPRSLENTEMKARSLETRAAPTKELIRKPSAIELARQTKPRVTAPAPLAVNYGKLLQDPKNMRAAFILSEILNRRVDY
ncbi:hypothetical protein [Adhaeribacter pallidiroseus]|uniref:Uncharacterized protein n=1 Tax=Adhaeribacter pallidiroseus TaxID=2072847 RepID=A0A369QK76_9BACT|nr:hypothetical protein [Adhaeribacter pallidiroseus]RDC63259.1 hypothetical protein AHMF7616_01860 [Adhaeribacter pallidiroseus]